MICPDIPTKASQTASLCGVSLYPFFLSSSISLTVITSLIENHFQLVVNIQPVISKGKNYCYKRVLHVPMFPGYVFVNVTPELVSELRCNRSVIRILDVDDYQEEVLIRS